VRFEVLTAVTINITAFRDVNAMDSGLYQRFGGIRFLLLVNNITRLCRHIPEGSRRLNALEVSEMLHADTMRLNVFSLYISREERIKI
jgi:hypothetical protein